MHKKTQIEWKINGKEERKKENITPDRRAVRKEERKNEQVND